MCGFWLRLVFVKAKVSVLVKAFFNGLDRIDSVAMYGLQPMAFITRL